MTRNIGPSREDVSIHTFFDPLHEPTTKRKVLGFVPSLIFHITILPAAIYWGARGVQYLLEKHRIKVKDPRREEQESIKAASRNALQIPEIAGKPTPSMEQLVPELARQMKEGKFFNEYPLIFFDEGKPLRAYVSESGETIYIGTGRRSKFEMGYDFSILRDSPDQAEPNGHSVLGAPQRRGDKSLLQPKPLTEQQIHQLQAALEAIKDPTGDESKEFVKSLWLNERSLINDEASVMFLRHAKEEDFQWITEHLNTLPPEDQQLGAENIKIVEMFKRGRDNPTAHIADMRKIANHIFLRLGDRVSLVKELETLLKTSCGNEQIRTYAQDRFTEIEKVFTENLEQIRTAQENFGTGTHRKEEKGTAGIPIPAFKSFEDLDEEKTDLCLHIANWGTDDQIKALQQTFERAYPKSLLHKRNKVKDIQEMLKAPALEHFNAIYMALEKRRKRDQVIQQLQGFTAIELVEPNVTTKESFSEAIAHATFGQLTNILMKRKDAIKFIHDQREKATALIG